jgi:hypothetical protein
VGIGTSSPSAKLSIRSPLSNSVPAFSLGEASDTNRFRIFQETDYTGISLDSGNIDLKLKTVNSFGSGGTMSFWTGVTTPTERMRISNTGNVGIGTISPAQKIHIKGSGAYDGQVFADNSSTTGSGIFSVGVNGTSVGFFATSGSAVGDTSTDLAMLAGPGNGLRFYSNETERMRIDSSGNLLIGTSIPPGTINSTAIRKGDGGQLILVANNGGLYHQDVGSYYLVTTAGGSTSDETLKKDVEQLSGALEKVCSIRGVNFEFIDDPMCTADKGVQLGVIAQEVEAVYPEIVLTNDEGKKTVRYDRLVAPLIEAVKEQQELIKAQGDLIAALEARIQALEEL